MARLQLTGLTKMYGDFRAVSDVDLDIGQGEVDWDEFFATLGRMKFDGNMTVCVFAWEERAHESSRYMRDTIEKRVQSWS